MDLRLTHILRNCALLFVCYFRLSEGHGHLVDPPSRSSMWQAGFRTPPNYNLNQLNCGGFYNHWVVNNGKCGVCGDPYQLSAPRDNESGGKYGQGIVTRTFTAGQKMTTKVLITANHMGWFEFRLCPDGSPSKPVTQSCLDKYVLPLADGSGIRYPLGAQQRSVSVDVMLPPGVTCAQCVLQWKWRAGNNYGRDTDGTTCKGCGPQEEFYGCSDITITSGSGQVPVTYVPVTTKPTTPAPQTTQPPIVTFPRITFPQYTNAVQTYGTKYPTFKPVSFPYLTRSTAAPPSSTRQPIIVPVSRPQGGATLPSGFVPISINPGLLTSSAAPYRTNPPVVTAPITTQSPNIKPSTTSRLQLITRSTRHPTQPTFRPQTTKAPIFTYPPFTLFPPFGRNNQNNIFASRQPTIAQSTFYRPPTTARPIVTSYIPTRPTSTPFYPIFVTNTQAPPMTTFYRPPTTVRATTKSTTPTTTTTTQAPPTTPPRCFAINSWQGVAELENYCQVQCTRLGGVCPSAFCACA